MDACDLTLVCYAFAGHSVAVDYYVYSSETRKDIRGTLYGYHGAFWGMWVTDKEWKRGQVYRDGRKSGKIFRKRLGTPRHVDASADYFPDTLRVEVSGRSPEYLFLGIFHPKGKWGDC